MATSEVLAFAEAIEDSKRRSGARSLLLGNGFSIDWNYKIFRYDSLYDDATFDGLSVDKAALFDELDTRDFEKVIEHLKSAADLADLYNTLDDDLWETFRADAQVVRHGLADVIARRHPNRAQEIKDVEAKHARAFLSNFRWIYTVNYDLLLYWVVNRTAASAHIVPMEDGFEWPTADGPQELIWKRSLMGTQRIFYLHGALHLFRERDKKLHKLKYGLAEPLIDQVRKRIEAGQYPRVVTEGRRTRNWPVSTGAPTCEIVIASFTGPRGRSLCTECQCRRTTTTSYSCWRQRSPTWRRSTLASTATRTVTPTTNSCGELGR
jgi:hypothetical protein